MQNVEENSGDGAAEEVERIPQYQQRQDREVTKMRYCNYRDKLTETQRY